MLVLSRRINESVMIDGEIEVTIVEVKGEQIRLGIKAPRHVTVDRKEVAEAKAKDREVLAIH